MCCFSRPVDTVSNTRILARPLADGTQLLAYGMTISAGEDLAMVLPIPVPAGSPDDAVTFIDLSAYPALFDDLDKAFPAPPMPRSRGLRSLGAKSAPKLVVHKVGAFEASFVPTVADFSRLDERFRLPTAALQALPAIADYGFAVFQLRASGGSAKEIHPMAFRFPRRDSSRVFFPTVHIHDGAVHADAWFDHALYLQSAGEPPRVRQAPWTANEQRVDRVVDVGRTAGLVDGETPVWRVKLKGALPNVDVNLAVG